MFRSVQPEFTSEQSLRDHLLAEIFASAGLARSGWARRHFERLFHGPTMRFSRLALRFDTICGDQGFAPACSDFLTHFVRDVQARGQEGIPSSGPLVVLANHPGAYDSVVISSCMPRDDYKIIVSDIPFLAGLRHAREHFIFTAQDAHIRMATMRAALRHLQDGGALLVFGSGEIDPDPAVFGQAKASANMGRWFKSIDLFLKQVPQTRTVIAIISGILLPRWGRHPLTLIRRGGVDRRRLAEFGQVIEQLVRPGHFYARPRLTFAPPVDSATLAREARGADLLDAAVTRARQVLADHMLFSQTR